MRLYGSFSPRTKMTTITALRNGTLAFQSPYDAGLVAALKSQIPHSDRKWSPDDKVWLIAPQHATTLADIAEQHLGERPKVPTIRAQAANTTQLLKVLYLGAAKDRGNETTSFAWVNGTWGAIFPLATLHEWFAVDTKPDEAPTLYAVLGVKRDIAPAKLKGAYRRAARQWHPDVCSDPDAGEQFRRIQHAYDVLKNPLDRRKYDAGLQLASTVERTAQGPQKTRFGWKPPLRCGYILAEGQESLGRFVVSKILQWEDIVDSAGRTLVTSWQYGNDTFTERWI